MKYWLFVFFIVVCNSCINQKTTEYILCAFGEDNIQAVSFNNNDKIDFSPYYKLVREDIFSHGNSYAFIELIRLEGSSCFFIAEIIENINGKKGYGNFTVFKVDIINYKISTVFQFTESKRFKMDFSDSRYFLGDSEKITIHDSDGSIREIEIGKIESFIVSGDRIFLLLNILNEDVFVKVLPEYQLAVFTISAGKLELTALKGEKIFTGRNGGICIFSRKRIYLFDDSLVETWSASISEQQVEGIRFLDNSRFLISFNTTSPDTDPRTGFILYDMNRNVEKKLFDFRLYGRYNDNSRILYLNTEEGFYRLNPVN